MAKRKRVRIVKPFQFFLLIFVIIAALALSVLLIMKVVQFLRHPGEPKNTPSVVSEVSSYPPDDTAPVIECEDERLFYIGNAMSYREGVTVTDDLDPEPTLTVDSVNVDLRTAGTYTYTLTATDRSGNTSSKEVKLTVLEKPKDYVSEEQILAEVDKVIDQIITEDMTKEDQIKAIYKYMRTNIAYGGSSDRTDYMQEAYRTLHKRRSDCYGFFAATKALLNRLGIENMDVVKVKVKPTDSNHFWNLVTANGTDWYHLDTTPRTGKGDDFCMVTDEFILNYSKAHNNSHNFDRSLYPATPEE